MRLVLHIGCVLLLGSCATLFNSKKKNITIYTDKPVHIAVDKDTVSGIRQELDMVVKRKKDPLFITVYNDTFSKTIKVNSRNSLAYWLNAYPAYTFLYGFLVDRNNPKRYTYPKDIYINLNDKEHDYHTTTIRHFNFLKPDFKNDDSIKTYKNQLKFYPLKTISTIRGIYVSYERLYGKANSTEFTAAYIVDPFSGPAFGTWSKMYGHAFGIEQKRFISKNAYGLNYAAVELSHRNCQFEMIYPFMIYNPKDSIEEQHGHMDTITIKHKIYNIGFKYGAQIYYKHFALEMNIGIGLRYREVVHLNKLHPKDGMVFPKDLTITGSTIADGKEFLPYFPLQLKLGYRF